MPTYVNVGARVNGERPKSKKALKDALANAPHTVVFDNTGPGGTYVTPDASLILSVCGPDPYTKRVWYGNVTVKAGKVVCS